MQARDNDSCSQRNGGIFQLLGDGIGQGIGHKANKYAAFRLLARASLAQVSLAVLKIRPQRTAILTYAGAGIHRTRTMVDLRRKKKPPRSRLAHDPSGVVSRVGKAPLPYHGAMACAKSRVSAQSRTMTTTARLNDFQHLRLFEPLVTLAVTA
jgi:hypothetical protein